MMESNSENLGIEIIEYICVVSLKINSLVEIFII